MAKVVMPVSVTVQEEGLGDVRPINTVVVLIQRKPWQSKKQAAVIGDFHFLLIPPSHSMHQNFRSNMTSHKEWCTVSKTTYHLKCMGCRP